MYTYERINQWPVMDVSYSGKQTSEFKALIKWPKNVYSGQTCRNSGFEISMFILIYSGCPVQWLTSCNSGLSLVTVQVVGLQYQWLVSNILNKDKDLYLLTIIPCKDIFVVLNR